MIIFKGVLSEKCLSQISKHKNINVAKLMSIVTIFSIIITVIMYYFDYSSFGEFLCLTLVSIVLNIAMLFVPHRSIVFKMPRTIKIDGKEIIKTIDDLNFPPKIMQIDDVKNVLDRGDWYFITFKRDITEAIICQKDWLVEGTLEEFETLFKDKLIRQYK